MTTKQAKENVIKNFRANYTNDHMDIHDIEVFLLNTLENIQLAVTSEIRKGLLKETTLGEHTLKVFDEIVKKI